MAWARPSLRRRERGLQPFFARKAETRRDDDLVGLRLHRRREGAERRRGMHDRDRTPIEEARLRRVNDVGLYDAADGVDGHVHRQLAEQLLDLVLGEVARAALLDAAA